MSPAGPDPVPDVPTPSFAHASEAEMARILDFYAVRWEYEPHTFPILWSLEGAVVESFAPDFYLPDLDLYLEMTTLKQRLVRKKNRKLRRLRELYPDLKVKLFYARDFRMLMLKYGKLGLIDTLSGTPGQVIPVRLPEAQLVEPFEPLEPPSSVPPDPIPVGPPAERLTVGPGRGPVTGIIGPTAPPRRARRRRRGRHALDGPATLR